MATKTVWKTDNLDPKKILLDMKNPWIEIRYDAMEHKRRENAVESAYASVRLEGFTISDEERAWAEIFVNGKISLAEFVNPKFDSRCK